ncbi:helix-turn-helix transcriptional regulator [Alcaligenes sp. SDU_A2]|uniref:helix-turn-helix transcriptional regulator n=1 Tax=Alcaligenes sp. SDU_A2 TaxID=3136634 RepID=UPI00311EAA03
MAPNNSTRIIRLPAVIDATGLARSTIYKGMADGTFPQSIQLGPRAVGWPESVIQKWISDRINSAGQ